MRLMPAKKMMGGETYIYIYSYVVVVCVCLAVFDEVMLGDEVALGHNADDMLELKIYSWERSQSVFLGEFKIK